MDAATLYMVLILASGEHVPLERHWLPNNRECQRLAQMFEADRSRVTAAYRRAGTLLIYCAPPEKPLVIAR